MQYIEQTKISSFSGVLYLFHVIRNFLSVETEFS